MTISQLEVCIKLVSNMYNNLCYYSSRRSLCYCILMHVNFLSDET